MDTEVMATTAVKARLALCKGLHSYINERDKEPIWDGHIYVYPRGSHSKNMLIGRVPVQVKGKRMDICNQTASIGYRIETSDLRNYLNEGGVLFFVVTIGSDRRNTIFFESLLPYDLQAVLKDIGEAKGKTISMRKLPDDDNAIRQIFLSFISNKRRQATQIVLTEEQAMEAARNGAALKFHIQPQNDIENPWDMMREVTINPFYMYVETKDGVELPFAKIEHGSCIETRHTLDASVFANGAKFYDKIALGYERGNAFLYIGRALKLPFAKKDAGIVSSTFNCTFSGTLTNRINDSDFLLAVSECNEIQIDNVVAFTINANDLNEVQNIKQLNANWKRIKTALDFFGVTDDLEMDSLTTADYHAIDSLIRAANKTTIFTEKGLPALFYYNRTIGNITVRVVAKKEENGEGYKLQNAFSDAAHVELRIVGEDNSERIINPWSLYILMKAADFLCSNVDYSAILNSIKAVKPSDRQVCINTQDWSNVSANSMLLEVITAYDSQEKKNKSLLQFARDLAEVIATEEPVSIINKFQVVKRQRALSNDEIGTLVNLRKQHNHQPIIKCAVSILLDEIDAVGDTLDALPDEDKKQIIDYPIYNIYLSAAKASRQVVNSN